MFSLLLAIVFFFDHPSNVAGIIPSSSPFHPSLESLGCDLSKGRWIPDRKAPAYTNQTCQAIQYHQNCMRNGRPDVNFLKWRWKPDGCELPRFNPVEFFELLRGKSLAFVGDSLARNQMQSLMCLLSRVEYPEDISHSKDENFKRMFYATYNFTMTILWAPFLVRAQEPVSDAPTLDGIWKLFLDEPDESWAPYVADFDCVVINGGAWFTRPLVFYEKRQVVGCKYCDIKHFPKLNIDYFHRMAIRTTLEAINKLENYNGITIVRTISPPHFENGLWDRGGDCARTGPARVGEMKMDKVFWDMYRNQVEEVEAARRAGKQRGMEFRLMDVTPAMLMRPDGHPGGYWSPAVDRNGGVRRNDCVHWCLPGPIDVWNDLLLEMMRQRWQYEGERGSALSRIV